MNKFITIILAIYSTFTFSDDFGCSKAVNSIEINYCAGVELENAEREMDAYLIKSKEHNSHDAELIKSIEDAQKAWLSYSDAHCESIYTKWREGAIRGAMHLSCKTKSTKMRTHEIWLNFLTYMDSTQLVLPEPKLN